MFNINVNNIPEWILSIKKMADFKIAYSISITTCSSLQDRKVGEVYANSKPSHKYCYDICMHLK